MEKKEEIEKIEAETEDTGVISEDSEESDVSEESEVGESVESDDSENQPDQSDGSEESDDVDKSEEANTSNESNMTYTTNESDNETGGVQDEIVSPSSFRVGDMVRVHFEVTEGTKKRVQPYEGLVIAMKGAGVSRTFMVRHIAKGGVGVERIFPINSPLIKKVDVLRRGKVRRAKLYYLRDRIGKEALKVKELR